MTALLNRAQFRDSVRRRLDQIPPVDQGIGSPGDQPFNAPWPTNAQINDTLLQALAYINVESGFRNTDFNIPVGAYSSTATGPASVYLGTQTLPNAVLNQVKRAVWDDGTDPVTILTMTGVGELDRMQSDYLTAGPATPQWFWVEGYSAFISPAPSLAGTLKLYVATSVYGLATDSDTIDQFPADLQGGVIDFTAMKLLGQQGGNQTKIAYFGAEVSAWTRLIQAWANGISGEYQPGFGFRSYRTGLGLRRVRR